MHKYKNLLALVLALALILAACGQPSPVANDLTEPLDEGLASLSFDMQQNVLDNFSSPFAKVGSQLTQLYLDRANVQPQNTTLLPLSNNYIVIDAVAQGDATALLSRLQTLGLQDGSVYDHIVSGNLPVASIEAMAKLTELKFARASMMTTNVGSVTSQGDRAQRSNLARTQSGFNGTGIKVGVLSDTFDFGGASSYAADVLSKDLPAGVTVLEEGTSFGADEGRAMAQIVYDVAPKSQLAFHTAFKGMANFAQGIVDLADAGADIIVDDVVYYAEPMFQDGIVAQAVDKVVKRGVPYFSSAINSARDSYESPFRSSTKTYQSRTLHDFDPGTGVDVLQDIIIKPFGTVLIALQWDEPFASVRVGNPGSSNDIDAFFFNAAGKLIQPSFTAISVSTNNNVGADPFEIVGIQNNSSSAIKVGLAIGLRTGTAPKLLKWVGFGQFQAIQFDTNSGTAYGHTNATGTASVGAAFYRRTPAFNTPVPLLETFSSAGGVPILFSINGTRRATALVRKTPDFVAPDGANTTFFYPGTDPESDGFPNFYGTSAAAPHAAGAAALMLDKNATATPTQIYNALSSTALNMGPAGYDYDTGTGLIRVDQAIVQIP
jgi:subtilisin family serine protease